MYTHHPLEEVGHDVSVPPRVMVSEAEFDRLGMLRVVENAVRRAGPVVMLAFPRSQREVTVLSSAAHVRLWQDNEMSFFKDYADPTSGGSSMRKVLGATLQTAADGDEWQWMRREMTDLLGSTKAWFQRPLAAATRELIDALLSRPETLLIEHCIEWATRAICDPLFNAPRLNRLARALLSDLDGNFYDLMAGREARKPGHQLESTFIDVMREIAAGCGPESIAAEIAEAYGAGGREERMRRIVGGLLAASVHMNAMTLFWMLLHLADSEVLQQRIRDEAKAFGFERRRVSETPIAFATVRETQRIKPITAFIERQVRFRMSVDGFVLLPGQTVLFSPWLVHRDPENWPDPLSFEPGRFLQRKPIDKGAYIPFGLGARVCPGANVVNQQLTFAASAVCQNLRLYRSSSTRPGDVAPMFRIVLEPRGPVTLGAEPIDQS